MGEITNIIKDSARGVNVNHGIVIMEGIRTAFDKIPDGTRTVEASDMLIKHCLESAAAQGIPKEEVVGSILQVIQSLHGGDQEVNEHIESLRSGINSKYVEARNIFSGSYDYNFLTHNLCNIF